MLLVITLLCKSTSILAMFFTVFRNEMKIIMGMWSSKCKNCKFWNKLMIRILAHLILS